MAASSARCSGRLIGCDIFAPLRPIPVADWDRLSVPSRRLCSADRATAVRASAGSGLSTSREESATSVSCEYCGGSRHGLAMTSHDTVRETIIGVLVREHTAHTPGFSDAAFRQITPGHTDTSVRQSLGEPYGESWFYPPRHTPSRSAAETSVASFPDECVAVRFQQSIVVSATGARVRQGSRSRWT
jgi:hypothetical protein